MLLRLVSIVFAVSMPWASATVAAETADLLLKGGRVLDGAGNPWTDHDIGITGDRITFIGNAEASHLEAKRVIDVHGAIVAPGFWDMHSHAEAGSADGRKMLPQLHQGITAVVLGVDGNGRNNIRETFDGYRRDGIAVNVLTYVGFNAARKAIMGLADRPATTTELASMQAYIAKGMEEGALGMSSGLFYVPGAYATTEEVIEVAKVSGRYRGIYDTHDRDMGMAYKGVGYLNSTREAIEIGERSGNRVIFSHFTPQGVENRGKGREGARIIDAARARGVNVMAAQHPYTFTNSNFRAYVLPPWAYGGGTAKLIERFQDPQLRATLAAEIVELVAKRGGADKLMFSDPDPALNGRTLAQKAQEWGVDTVEAVRRITTREKDADVMNIGLYDQDNIDYLGRQEWMMTCTDGESPRFGEGIVHPRSYGSFPKKIREAVYDKQLVSLPFVIRGMTSLPTQFLNIPGRGLLKVGYFADIVVFDEQKIHGRADLAEPHRYGEGMIHVLVNGRLALENGTPTGVLAGRPIARGGE